ncbi:MAG: 50S ribosomal protein L33 [Bacteroidales bacterium]|nr:50S ribosomal protein L33 [Bacteroidales bacterium]
MAKKAKGNRVQVILESIETNAEGKSMVSRYITTKNKKNTPERIERRKYHAGVGKVTVHKEIK